MRRYDTKFEDGRFYVESDEGWLVVGETDHLVDLLGETYTLEYDDAQRKVSWLNTDEDGQLSFDVIETLADLTFDEELVSELESHEYESDPNYDYPVRTEVFVDMIRTIWDNKGNIDR